MKVRVIPFNQPMGLFLAGVMKASDLLKVSKVDRRRYDALTLDPGDGFQREPSPRRINEIAAYSGTVDATFPTPILLALNGDDYTYSDNTIDILRPGSADIIDGQHRMMGLEGGGFVDNFELPVVFILDPTEEQKALIFATINGKQTKVPASLVYDLFGVTTTRSPQKTAHEVVRALNKNVNSPWYRRLKMLGRKMVPGSNETLSQGTFVKFLLPLISDSPVEDMDAIKRGRPPQLRPACIFSNYFVENRDENIMKVLMNAFGAAKACWPQEWDDPTISILSKTTGFSGIMRALPEVFRGGQKSSDLSESYFLEVFQRTKSIMEERKIPLSSAHFSSSASGEAEFAELIRDGLQRALTAK